MLSDIAVVRSFFAALTVRPAALYVVKQARLSVATLDDVLDVSVAVAQRLHYM